MSDPKYSIPKGLCVNVTASIGCPHCSNDQIRFQLAIEDISAARILESFDEIVAKIRVGMAEAAENEALNER